MSLVKSLFDIPSVVLVLAVLSVGCTSPRHSISLNHVLEKELRGSRAVTYGYRCTTGAHRGSSLEHRENTLSALKAAEDNPKYAFVEFDVQYSKDDQIVVFHDLRLLRLFGKITAVGHATMAELSELTNGEIVTYRDVMNVLNKKVNIEIKSQGDHAEDRRLADEIIADIKERRRIHDVLISSISGEVIQYIKSAYPEIRTGQIFWLTSSTFFHVDRLTRNLYEKLNSSKADYLMLHVSNLRNIEYLLKNKPRGKTIVFWDFDDSMYVVHKDMSDRLWGDSAITEFFNRFSYLMMVQPPRRSSSKRAN